jgi:hypothetical protein
LALEKFEECISFAEKGLSRDPENGRLMALMSEAKMALEKQKLKQSKVKANNMMLGSLEKSLKVRKKALPNFKSPPTSL